ncbi:MAG: hypothetical protein ACO1Q7_05545 [Gemmatimonas sp.]
MNLAFILSMLAVAICLGVVFVSQRSKSKIAHERDGLSAFRSENKNRGYPDTLLEGAYLYLAERAPAPGPHYAVSMSDNLQHTYGLSDLDLEDAVLVIADKAGARLPKASDLDGLRTSVTTVEDMLRFLKPYFQK